MIRASAGQADLSPEQIARVKDLLAPVYAGIDRIEEATGIDVLAYRDSASLARVMVSTPISGCSSSRKRYCRSRLVKK